ncbi:MAG: PDZ domain-containing protein [Bacteroidales bacterium]|nr:PDZ domain-containing protein [Bacteroidales bacterium]
MSKSNRNFFIAVILSFFVGVLLTLVLTNGKIRRAKIEAYTAVAHWPKLNLIMNQISANYVDTINVESLTDVAANAVFKALDPHSMYMPPEEKKSSDESLAANFEGIGITFNVPEDTAVVISVIPGGPSSKVGLLPGDKLIKADSVVVAGVKMPQDDMVRHFKGPKDSKVKMTVLRGDETIVFDIIRDKIPMNSIDAAFVINGTSTGYMRLSKFSESSYREFIKSLAILEEKGITDLIFDLRDNTGGYFEQAVLLANEFLAQGDTIVYLKGLHRDLKIYQANGKGLALSLGDKPLGLKVLVNEYSASSSEIFAGAIQDNHRGEIIGRRTFGKGLVQESIPFSDGSGIRLTVSRYYTPSGRCIQKPYDKYETDIYSRYIHGEMVSRDSVKVDEGGIMPDVFVGIDTTRANDFHIAVNKKSVIMRFSNSLFQRDKEKILAIKSFSDAEKYISSINIENQFVEYAVKSGVPRPTPQEWNEAKDYILPHIEGLVLRYSPLGEEAYYQYVIPMDDTIQEALKRFTK